MSNSMHLIPQNTTGYCPSDGRCLPCSGLSGRAVAVSSSSFRGDYKSFSQVKTASLKCSSKGAAFACNANSGGHRRNPDFSQRKQGFSRNRNRQNEEKHNNLELEDSELLSSKNGQFLSITNAPKYQATASPGPREKEIVELFRKVQAQLRERAAIKEEKKVESLQGHSKEGETVDSLLKLLRKHSAEQSKRKVSGGGNKESWVQNQSKQNGSLNTEKNTADTNMPLSRDEPEETNGSSFSRPTSNFRRRSPVPQVKYQHGISLEKDTNNSIPHVTSDGNKKKTVNKIIPEPELEPEFEHEAVLEPEPDPEPIFSNEDVYDEVSEDELSDIEAAYTDEDAEIADQEEPVEMGELSALKLIELKALAKSRGMKGFSKLKKSDLVELLSK